MDNLYNSDKFCKDSWNHPKCVMVLCVTRKVIYGLPYFIRHSECAPPIDMDWYQGTVKAAVLENNPEFKELIDVSVYEIKLSIFIYENRVP